MSNFYEDERVKKQIHHALKHNAEGMMNAMAIISNTNQEDLEWDVYGYAINHYRMKMKGVGYPRLIYLFFKKYTDDKKEMLRWIAEYPYKVPEYIKSTVIALNLFIYFTDLDEEVIVNMNKYMDKNLSEIEKEDFLTIAPLYRVKKKVPT